MSHSGAARLAVADLTGLVAEGRVSLGPFIAICLRRLSRHRDNGTMNPLAPRAPNAMALFTEPHARATIEEK
jgi:hypothetical protein